MLSKRSPGSALKPFIYAIALDRGVLHPRTILRDSPTSFGPFTPENFDGRFLGPVTAEEALIRSRNVPAVWVSPMQLKQPNFYAFLQSAGISRLKPESYYGLALALGGGEVTMEELAGLYGMLANQGVLRPVRAASYQPRKAYEGARLLSPEASFITLDMLRRNPRPDEDGAPAMRGHWPVAWKTGTSWGFRDAWSARVVGQYVLVVWIGEFSERGIRALWESTRRRRCFSASRARRSPRLRWCGRRASAKWRSAPRAAICPTCGARTSWETWYIPGKSRSRSASCTALSRWTR